MKRKVSYLTLTVFLILVLLGIKIIISEYYYYSAALWLVYLLGIVLLFILLKWKLYIYPLSQRQYLALIPVFLLLLGSWFIVPHFLRYGVYPFSLLCFLYTGLLLYNSGLKRLKFIFIFSFIIFSLNLVTVFFYLAEESLITRPLINALIISNIKESTEYLLGKLSVSLAVVAIVFVGSSLFLFLPATSAKPRIEISWKTIFCYFLAFGLTFFMSPMSALTSAYRLYKDDRKLMQKMIDDRRNGYLGTPFKIYHRPEEAVKVMIIIGESLNRNLMSIYGYPKRSTPRLEHLLRDTLGGKLYVFNNVISPEVSTMPSLQKVLTNINNVNHIHFESAITLVDLFRTAGYESFWISNQSSMGPNDTPNAVFAMTTDHQFFTDSRTHVGSSNADSGNYFDSELLPILQNYTNKKNSTLKQIYFIHLMGSHYSYNDRYPLSFEHFKPLKEGDTNSYLNTVYFNDWVVGTMMNIAQNNNFDVVCYFSDHGEDLDFQHNQEKYRRGMSEVPFMVYLSKSYSSKNPELSVQLSKNKNTPGMTDNFFQDIQLISGFSSSLFNPRESFLSKKYIVRKRRVINSTIGYD